MLMLRHESLSMISSARRGERFGMEAKIWFLSNKLIKVELPP